VPCRSPFARGLQIAQFVRWAGHGAFLSIANPYSAYSSEPCADGACGGATKLAASYAPLMVHRATALEGEAHATDPAVLGLTNLSAYFQEGVNTLERAAFVSCVDSFHLDKASRAGGTVKVNVACADAAPSNRDWAWPQPASLVAERLLRCSQVGRERLPD
jgi:hypothetical protein